MGVRVVSCACSIHNGELRHPRCHRFDMIITKKHYSGVPMIDVLMTVELTVLNIIVSVAISAQTILTQAISSGAFGCGSSNAWISCFQRAGPCRFNGWIASWHGLEILDNSDQLGCHDGATTQTWCTSDHRMGISIYTKHTRISAQCDNAWSVSNWHDCGNNNHWWDLNVRASGTWCRIRKCCISATTICADIHIAVRWEISLQRGLQRFEVGKSEGHREQNPLQNLWCTAQTVSSLWRYSLVCTTMWLIHVVSGLLVQLFSKLHKTAPEDRIWCAMLRALRTSNGI